MYTLKRLFMHCNEKFEIVIKAMTTYYSSLMAI